MIKEHSFKYNAFISYSQTSDRLLAQKLQAAVARFGKPWYRRRAAHVFRDSTSIATTPGLWSTIEEALRSSEFLILLASPGSAASPWVEREVAFWKSQRPLDRLILLLTDGEILWDNAAADFEWARTVSLPGALCATYAEEPLYIDLRWVKEETDLSLRHPRFIDAVATLAATLHGASKEDVVGEEIRQYRRTRTVIWSTAAVLSTLLVGICLAGFLTYKYRKEADAKRSAAIQSIHDVADTAIDTFLAMDAEGFLSSEPTRGLRRRVLDAASARMADIATDLSDDPDTIRDLAEEYIRLADRVHKAGDPAEALTAYNLAARALEKLDRSGRATSADRLRSTFVHNNIANVLGDLGETEKATEEYRRVTEIRERLHHQYPDDIESMRQLSVSYGNLGLALFTQGQADEATKLMRKAIDIETRLFQMKGHPRHLWFQLNLSYSWNNLANVQEEYEQDPRAALESRKRALELRKNAVASYFASAETPALSEFLQALGRGHSSLALTLTRLGRSADALKHFCLAEDTLREAQRRSQAEYSSTTPNHAILHDLASTRIQRGELLDRLGDTAAALQVFSSAADDVEPLTPLYGSIPRYGLTRIEALSSKAAMLSKSGDRAGAEKAAATALEAARSLARQHPADPTVMTVLARLTLLAAPSETVKGQRASLEGLTRTMERAAAMMRGSGRAFRDLPEFKARLAAAYHALGEVCQQLRDTPSAVVAFEASRAMHAELVKGDPESSEYRQSLASNCVALAIALGTFDPKRAISMYDQAVGNLEAVLGHAPDDVAGRLGPQLADVLYGFARELAGQERHERAAECLRKAIGLIDAKTTGEHVDKDLRERSALYHIQLCDVLLAVDYWCQFFFRRKKN